MYEFLTILFMIISSILGYLQWENTKKGNYSISRKIKPHKNIEIVNGKTNVVELLNEILIKSKKGDTVFGQCNTCSNYNKDFYLELNNALDRGVNFKIIVKETTDSEQFIEKLLNLKKMKPNQIHIFTTDLEYMRTLGIENQEIILALSLNDDYIGIHINDKNASKYFNKSFDKVIEHSVEIEKLKTQ